MSIRIVNCGISALEIAPLYDECVIESVMEKEQTSFVMDLKDGKSMYKRIRSDADVAEYISNLYIHDEISSITKDENRDIIIMLRQMGEEPLDIEDVPEVIE